MREGVGYAFLAAFFADLALNSSVEVSQSREKVLMVARGHPQVGSDRGRQRKLRPDPIGHIATITIAHKQTLSPFLMPLDRALSAKNAEAVVIAIANGDLGRGYQRGAAIL